MNLSPSALEFLRDIIAHGNLIPDWPNDLPFCQYLTSLRKSSKLRALDAFAELERNGVLKREPMPPGWIQANNVHPVDYMDYWSISWTDAGKKFINEIAK